MSDNDKALEVADISDEALEGVAGGVMKFAPGYESIYGSNAVGSTVASTLDSAVRSTIKKIQEK